MDSSLCTDLSLYTDLSFYFISPFNIDSSLYWLGLGEDASFLQIHCTYRKALIKRLKDHLGSEADDLKKFQISSRTFGQKVVDLKVLNEMAY